MMATTSAPPSPTVRFRLPSHLSATEPPEARGLARDQIRLLVATPARIRHARFRDLGEHLKPGDLVVINTSATLPAASDAVRADGRRVVVHVAGPHPHVEDRWVVELRRTDGNGPVTDAQPGEVLGVAEGLDLILESPYEGDRLWRAYPLGGTSLRHHLDAAGRPITYGYLSDRWPLHAYQPVFATTPGSAEMASAGRPFTDGLLADLITRGVAVAPIELHAGVSSLEVGEPPPPERYAVPEVTARLVDATRRRAGRVVAVGTTVTRALETVAGKDGSIGPGRGWTDLVIGPERLPRVVDGLITGWHAPEASHLMLLEAVAGAPLVQRAYDAAIAGGYLWHEFGDSALFLPGSHRRRQARAVPATRLSGRG